MVASTILFLALFSLPLHLTWSEIIETPCQPKDFGNGAAVCVCTADHCDSFEVPESIPETGQFLHVFSTEDGDRFAYRLNETASADHFESKEFSLTINRKVKYQKILGFGGAFTDAAGMNLASLSKPLQEKMIQSYFGTDGLKYTLGRVPMAGSDFSTHTYSYDDVVNDTALTNFQLTEEDLKFKIPNIRKALDLQPSLKLIACPWTAPPWMKTNGKYNGKGSLREEYYQVWAEYYVRFLEEYEKQGLSHWGISAGNEPLNGLIPFFPFNCMGWTAEQQRDWIKTNLGPTLEKNFSNVKILIFEDQRPFLTHSVQTVMSDPDAAKYVSGIGLHWYMNWFPISALDEVHTEFPDTFLLATEACTGTGFQEPVRLGSWSRGESYSSDIIQSLNHWVTGWIDWNFFLDLGGGPNWARNFVDAPIIVDPSIDTAYKQPMFYHLGHFSKFIPEDSVRIESTLTSKLFKDTLEEIPGIQALSVLRPDGKIVVIVLSILANSYNLEISDPDLNPDGSSTTRTFTVEIKSRSINTIVY